jgi:neurofibromin 1
MIVQVSYEIDPTRLEPNEVLDDNKRNLLEMTQKVFTAIVESAPK